MRHRSAPLAAHSHRRHARTDLRRLRQPPLRRLDPPGPRGRQRNRQRLGSWPRTLPVRRWIRRRVRRRRVRRRSWLTSSCAVADRCRDLGWCCRVGRQPRQATQPYSPTVARSGYLVRSRRCYAPLTTPLERADHVLSGPIHAAERGATSRLLWREDHDSPADNGRIQNQILMLLNTRRAALSGRQSTNGKEGQK